MGDPGMFVGLWVRFIFTGRGGQLAKVFATIRKFWKRQCGCEFE